MRVALLALVALLMVLPTGMAAARPVPGASHPFVGPTNPVEITGKVQATALDGSIGPMLLPITSNSRVGVWVYMRNATPANYTLALSVGPTPTFKDGTTSRIGNASLTFFFAEVNLQIPPTVATIWVNATGAPAILAAQAICVQFSTTDGLDDFNANASTGRTDGSVNLTMDVLHPHDLLAVGVVGQAWLPTRPTPTFAAFPTSALILNQTRNSHVGNMSNSLEVSTVDVPIGHNVVSINVTSHVKANWLMVGVSLDPPAPNETTGLAAPETFPVFFFFLVVGALAFVPMVYWIVRRTD